MFSDLSLDMQKNNIHYPITDSKLPFSEYIKKTRSIIEERRIDLNGSNAAKIIDANSPFEMRPQTVKCGALLIHGLLDCPFSLRDIGEKLAENGVLCRSILLPGHGTRPADLLNTSYHQWIQAMRYGVESLKHEVDQLYIVGYSTGAALAVYQALQDAAIKGIILLAPAIKIKAPVDVAVAWHRLSSYFTKENKQWLFKDKEVDYTKYHSIPLNAVFQVADLTKVIRELNHQKALTTPLYMAMSREDETVSSHQAINFFSQLHNPKNRFLLYTSIDHRYPDSRIATRLFKYETPKINHCSHVAIPFAPDNPHYGALGDAPCASRSDLKNVVYGAYNRIEEQLFNIAHKIGLTRMIRRELTYNPDFDFMADDITQFILTS